MRHLIRKDSIFDEINHLNQFWSRYITFTYLICSSLFCYTLYISLMTQAAVFMKLFFISVSVAPLIMLLVTTAYGAVPHDTLYRMRNIHISLMSKNVTKDINFYLKLKVGTTHWEHIFQK
mgnify:CR=1 FL=1